MTLVFSQLAGTSYLELKKGGVGQSSYYLYSQLTQE